MVPPVYLTTSPASPQTGVPLEKSPQSVMTRFSWDDSGFVVSVLESVPLLSTNGLLNA